MFLETAGSLRHPPERTPHAFGDYYGRSLLNHDKPLHVAHSLPRWPVVFQSAPYEEETDEDEDGIVFAVSNTPDSGHLEPSLLDVLIENSFAPDAELRATGLVWHASVKILAGHLMRELSAFRETLLRQILPNNLKSRAHREWIRRAPLRCITGYSPFREFVFDSWAWAQAETDWSKLDDQGRQRLWRSTERLDREFERFAPETRSLYSVGLRGAENLARDTLKYAATGSDEAWTALPAPVREHINNHELVPGGDPERHQMFGLGRIVQAGVCERLDQILLLQLTYDSFGSLWPGDVGIMTWWIRPEHLEARKWTRVEFMFECH